MSAEATSWVWKNSPYTGTSMVLHLAVADVANDTHDCRVWISPTTLAEKAHTPRETASRWLWSAVKDGLLEVVSDRRNQRDERGYRMPSEFRFLMPSDASVHQMPRDEESRGLVTSDHEACDDTSQVTKRDLTQEETRRPRKTDPLWEAMVDVCGLTNLPLTASERGRANKALKQLRDVGATPEEIRRRAQLYRSTFQRASLTPTALAANWSTLVAGGPSSSVLVALGNGSTIRMLR